MIQAISARPAFGAVVKLTPKAGLGASLSFTTLQNGLPGGFLSRQEAGHIGPKSARNDHFLFLGHSKDEVVIATSEDFVGADGKTVSDLRKRFNGDLEPNTFDVRQGFFTVLPNRKVAVLTVPNEKQQHKGEPIEMDVYDQAGSYETSETLGKGLFRDDPKSTHYITPTEVLNVVTAAAGRPTAAFWQLLDHRQPAVRKQIQGAARTAGGRSIFSLEA